MNLDTDKSFQRNYEVLAKRNSASLLPDVNSYQNLKASDNIQSSARLFEQNSQPSLQRSAYQADPNSVKKVYTYNILTNTPIPKYLPTKAKIPYGYAMTIDHEKLDSLKMNSKGTDNGGITERLDYRG